SIFHPKKTKIEDIFHGCLRFFGSKGTNGSAPLEHYTLEITEKDGKYYVERMTNSIGG
ncbi:hypothetical protein V048_02039, partial [Staphylococcus aureus S69_POEL]